MNTKTSRIPFPFYLARAREILNGKDDQVFRLHQAPRLALASKIALGGNHAPQIVLGINSQATINTISIQASENHYCEPRKNLEFWMYDSFECGFPTCQDPIIEPYNDGDGVYPRVPTAVLQAYIDKMGGIVGYVSNYRTGDFSPIPLTHEEALMYALKG